MPTKDEISQELKEAQKRIEKLEQDLKQQRETTLSMAAKDSGWLITAPNSLYSGTKYGISFLNGQAFVRVNQKVPYFQDEVQPMSPGQLDKFVRNQYPTPPYSEKYRDKKKKEVRDREKEMTTAWMAVRSIESDFGYEVTEFSPEDRAELESRLNERAKQAKAIAEMQEQSREDVEKIVEPGYFGRPK